MLPAFILNCISLSQFLAAHRLEGDQRRRAIDARDRRLARAEPKRHRRGRVRPRQLFLHMHCIPFPHLCFLLLGDLHRTRRSQTPNSGEADKLGVLVVPACFAAILGGSSARTTRGPEFAGASWPSPSPTSPPSARRRRARPPRRPSGARAIREHGASTCRARRLAPSSCRRPVAAAAVGHARRLLRRLGRRRRRRLGALRRRAADTVDAKQRGELAREALEARLLRRPVDAIDEAAHEARQAVQRRHVAVDELRQPWRAPSRISSARYARRASPTRVEQRGRPAARARARGGGRRRRRCRRRPSSSPSSGREGRGRYDRRDRAQRVVARWHEHLLVEERRHALLVATKAGVRFCSRTASR